MATPRKKSSAQPKTKAAQPFTGYQPSQAPLFEGPGLARDLMDDYGPSVVAAEYEYQYKQTLMARHNAAVDPHPAKTAYADNEELRLDALEARMQALGRVTYKRPWKQNDT